MNSGCRLDRGGARALRVPTLRRRSVAVALVTAQALPARRNGGAAGGRSRRDRRCGLPPDVPRAVLLLWSAAGGGATHTRDAAGSRSTPDPWCEAPWRSGWLSCLPCWSRRSASATATPSVPCSPWSPSALVTIATRKPTFLNRRPGSDRQCPVQSRHSGTGGPFRAHRARSGGRLHRCRRSWPPCCTRASMPSSVVATPHAWPSLRD